MARQHGFTLVELVVTVALVGLLASVAVPMVEVTVQRTREQELRTALRQIRTALDEHKQAHDQGRIPRRADGNGYPRKLEDLVNGVADPNNAQAARVYFLRRLPRDPFYTDATTPAADTWGKRSYKSPPDAPAEGEDVYDVYSLSERKALNGQLLKAW